MIQLKTNRLFLESATRDWKHTGAVAPSSKALAQAMTRELVLHYRCPAHVLEVGAGTGSITKEIARQVRPGDHLDVYEIDRRLATLLRHRIERDASFRMCGASIRVFARAIETLERQRRYDFVLSCLPFTNFTPEAVRDIFEIFRSVLRPGGVCSFYEYLGVRRAASLMSGKPSARARMEGVARVVRHYIDRYGYRHETVLRNLPPAKVHHIRFAC